MYVDKYFYLKSFRNINFISIFKSQNVGQFHTEIFGNKSDFGQRLA